MQLPHNMESPDAIKSQRVGQIPRNMCAILNQSEVSISFKTGGYTKCVIYKYQTKFQNTSYGNAIFSGLANASNLIPICVIQTCPGVQYLFSSIWTQTSRSYRKSSSKLVENGGYTYIDS